MIRKSPMLLSILIVTLIGLGLSKATEIVENPSFETGEPTPWQYHSPEDGFTVFEDGSLPDVPSPPDGIYYAGTIIKENGRAWQYVTVIPGRRYWFSLYAYTDGYDTETGQPTPGNQRYRFGFAPFYQEDGKLTYGNQHGYLGLYYSHPLFYKHHVWACETWGLSYQQWGYDSMPVRAEDTTATVIFNWAQLNNANQLRNLFDNVRLDEIDIPKGTISGYVTDACDGNPVEGATIMTEPWGYTGQSDSNGFYIITDLPESMYSLTAQKIGYELTRMEGIRVYANRVATGDIALIPGPVINPSFEQADPLDEHKAVGWTNYGDGLSREQSGQWFMSIPSHSGDYFMGMATNWWPAKYGGIYQQVTVEPGHNYRASVFILTYKVNANPTCRIGIDPNGGTDPSVVTLWSPATQSQMEWIEISVEGTANGDVLTIFLDYSQPLGEWSINCFDDVSLTDLTTGQQMQLKFPFAGSLGNVHTATAQTLSDSNQTLLLNGGFESSDTYNWTRAYKGGQGRYEWCRRDPLYVATSNWPSNFGITPPEGDFMFGGTHSWDWGGAREILYQNIPAIPGQWYRLSAKVYTDYTGTPQGEPPYVRLKASPAGGTSFPISTSKLRTNGTWEEFTLDFQADCNWPTVAVELVQGGWMEWAHYYVDDINVIHLDSPPGGGSGSASKDDSIDKLDNTQCDWPVVIYMVPNQFALIDVPGTEDDLEMVWIPAGEFQQGSGPEIGYAREDEFPRHTVYTDGFWISKTETSNEQYRAFLNANPDYNVPPDPDFLTSKGYIYGYPYFWNNPTLPVVNVNWYEAKAFCDWLGLRLPTEAEWEKAAGWDGNNTRVFPYGNDFIANGQNANDNCPGDNFVFTCPVWQEFKRADGTKGPQTYWGCYNMTGNVWEWTADWYGPYSDEYQVNPTGPESGDKKVLKGGSYKSLEYIVDNRNAARFAWVPDFYSWGEVGFRVCASNLPIPGDFDDDEDVDLDDYAYFTNYWMNQNCGEPDWCNCADLDRSGSVDWHDLSRFVNHWLVSSE